MGRADGRLFDCQLVRSQMAQITKTTIVVFGKWIGVFC